MVSTVTASSVAGFQGKVNDQTWALIAQNIGALDATVNGLTPTGSTSVRQVTTAAGSSFFKGARAQWNSASTLDVPVPTSGGQWYLLAVHYVVATKVAELVLLAGATGTDASQGSVPIALPGGYIDNTGVEGHQGIAWVYSRVGYAGVQVFDLRLLRTGGGNLLAPTLLAAIFAVAAGRLQYGAHIEVGAHPLPNNSQFGITRAHLVVRDDGKLNLLTGTSIGMYGEQGALFSNGLVAQANALKQLTDLYPGQYAWNENDTTRAFSGEARWSTNGSSRFLLWNAPNINLTDFVSLQGDVGFDFGSGLNECEVVNGTVVLSISVYTNNVRGPDGYWGALGALRPTGPSAFAAGRSYSAIDANIDGIMTNRIAGQDGGLVAHRFGVAQGGVNPGRANGFSCTWKYRIAQ